MSFTAAMTSAHAALLATMGEAITIAGVAKTGIYSGAYEETNLALGQVEGFAPHVLVAAADAVAVVHGTAVVARGTTYYVVNIQPDGEGLTALVLSKQTD